MSSSTYEYTRLRVDSNTWESVSSQVIAKAAESGDESVGRLFGVWTSQIGPSVNEGVMITSGPDEESAHTYGQFIIGESPEIRSSQSEILDPTSRPIDDTPPPAGGIYTHRWFTVKSDDWEEFLRLSQQSWPQWESVFDAKLYGFLKSRARGDDDLIRVLLLCRYKNLQHWQESRWWAQDADEAAKEALDLQRRRREITVDTSVAMMRFVGP